MSSLEMQDLTLQEEHPRLLNCIIDASINGGNSGGPVVSEKTGKVKCFFYVYLLRLYIVCL